MTKLPILFVVFAAFARAGIQLPALFSDHMVLQRDVAIPVWGTAEPGQEVTVEFAGDKQRIAADSSGKWMMRLHAVPASDQPRDLIIGSIVLHDVLVGEVWLGSGQSNMAFGLNAAHNAAEVLPTAEDSQLRFFTVAKNTASTLQTNFVGKWEASTPQTAKGFSAVAYFFAREIRRTQHCPVAIVHSSWGGTPIETWISLEALRRDPPVTKALSQWEKAVEQNRIVHQNPKLAAAYESDLKRWKAEAKPGSPAPNNPEPINPDPMGIPSPSKRPQTPSISFNAMIAPAIPYAIRGVLWYQGEQNGGAGLEYRELLPRLIGDWRRLWGSQLPFLYVQLPANGKDVTPVAEKGWPWLREAQLLTLAMPGTSMAITIDVGDPDNVHPTDKIDVGQRLALLARRDVYGEKIVASGPLYKGFATEDASIRVKFRETGRGLMAGQAPWRPANVEPLPADQVIGFYIAGDDHRWYEANAAIDGDSVLVSSGQVARPVAVRYGWANSPRCNLYNKDGLPASPFRTDDWSK